MQTGYVPQGYKRQNGEAKVEVKEFVQERLFHHDMDSSTCQHQGIPSIS